MEAAWMRLGSALMLSAGLSGMLGLSQASDRGVNQPGALGNPRADPGVNQPGAAGSIGGATRRTVR